VSLGRIIVALWIAWALSWFGASFWRDRPQKSVGLQREWAYRLVLVIGGGLLAVPAHRYEGWLRLWRLDRAQAWGCIAVMVVGFAFCWWGRIHLGRLWSGQITKKADHRVVDTGPYGIVRHPIYTGILAAVLGTAIAKGTLYGLVGALGLAIGLWMKARLEEEWLRGELGKDAYDSYRVRVPMLVPFGPRGRRPPPSSPPSS
jgi:protein-S-isoprenylcysteine O-methyltransferase Ste14